MTTPTETAEKILAAANRLGFTVTTSNTTMTVSKQFTPGNKTAFIQCDATYYEVLNLLPRVRPGSDWGADGGGIGGHVSLKNGYFNMHRSGGSKRVLAALRRLY